MTHRKFTLVLLLLGCAAAAAGPAAQTTKPRTAAQIIREVIAQTERELTGIAEEMPADKYDFAPTQGAFQGVRTFAAQVKHAAAVHYLIAASLLGETITPDMAEERGPDSVKTKAEVLKYLKDSFVALNRTAASINDKNAFTPLKGPGGSPPDTRMGAMLLALTHSSNHYGQLVEYLSMNGHVPPQ